MWNNNGKTWYSEDEYQALQDKLKDMEAKYEFAIKQNNTVYKQYEAVLEQLKQLNKEVNND